MRVFFDPLDCKGSYSRHDNLFWSTTENSEKQLSLITFRKFDHVLKPIFDPLPISTEIHFFSEFDWLAGQSKAGSSPVKS